MAFDRTNPTHLAELKAEVATDPDILGYDPLDTQAGVLDVLNLKRATYTISKPAISAALIRSTVTFDAYNTLSIDEQEWIRWVTGSNGFQEENLTVTPDLRTQLTGPGAASIWSAGNRDAMNQAMLALMDVDASRAENLWGYATSITREDWFAARDS